MRYELRSLMRDNKLDSTYESIHHAQGALDELDRAMPASFYVLDADSGKHYFSFAAMTKFPHIEIRGTAMQKAYLDYKKATR